VFRSTWEYDKRDQLLLLTGLSPSMVKLSSFFN
jgi:hypothetical protein